MGTIYMFTNKVNGKKYVGKSHVDVLKRQKSHIGGYGNAPLKRAIDKYGIDNFDFEILHDGVFDELLDDYEKSEIKKHNCVKPNGYNQNYGGGGVITHSEETRHKLSKRMSGKNNPNYGKKHSDKTKRKISEKAKDRTGENNPMYGKKHSDETRRKLSGKKHSKETRRKISEAKKGKMSGENNPFYGKKHSDKTKRKISGENHHMYGRTGKNNPNYGKKHSDKTKRKISKARCHPEYELAHQFFAFLPPTLSLTQKRKLLREEFSYISESAIYRWVRKWTKP